MKIAFIYRNNNVHILRRAEGLAKQGLEVHYIGFEPDDSQINIEKFKFIKKLLIPNVIKGKLTFIDFIINRKKITKYIKKNKIDLVHVQSPIYYVPLIGSSVVCLIENMGSDVIKIGRNIIRRALFWIAYRNAKYIIQDSMLSKVAGIKLGASKKNNEILDIGVNLVRFTGRHSKETAKKMLGFGEDQFVIFSIRTMVENSCIEEILEAIPSVVKAIDNAIFVFATSPRYRSLNEKVKSYKAQFPNNIRICGYIDNDKEMPIYLSASDVVISIPQSDSSPLSVFEAMACRVPVIIRKHGWYHGKFDENVHFKMYDPKSDMLDSIILNRNDDSNIVDNAFQEVIRNYSQDRMSSRLVEIYKEVLAVS